MSPCAYCPPTQGLTPCRLLVSDNKSESLSVWQRSEGLTLACRPVAIWPDKRQTYALELERIEGVHPGSKLVVRHPHTPCYSPASILGSIAVATGGKHQVLS